MTDKDKKIQSKEEKTVQEDELWAHITKDVTPLKDKNAEEIHEKPTKKHVQQQKTYKSAPAQNTSPPARSNEVDRKTAQRLQRGQIPIDGRLDMHGMTQNEAYDALLSFIPNAYSQGKKCVLIITGKGNKQDFSASLLDQRIGILKQRTPEWLNSPPLNTYVLKIQPARPNHGGEGALYVLLRRQRR